MQQRCRQLLFREFLNFAYENFQSFDMSFEYGNLGEGKWRVFFFSESVVR